MGERITAQEFNSIPYHTSLPALAGMWEASFVHLPLWGRVDTPENLTYQPLKISSVFSGANKPLATETHFIGHLLPEASIHIAETVILLRSGQSLESLYPSVFVPTAWAL